MTNEEAMQKAWSALNQAVAHWEAGAMESAATVIATALLDASQGQGREIPEDWKIAFDPHEIVHPEISYHTYIINSKGHPVAAVKGLTRIEAVNNAMLLLSQLPTPPDRKGEG